MKDTVAIPRACKVQPDQIDDPAVRTALHFQNLTENGVQHDLAEVLADRYHECLMDYIFGKQPSGGIGFTDAYSSDMVEEGDD